MNPKKCNVFHAKRAKKADDAVDLKLDETASINNLNTESNYKFFDVGEFVIRREVAFEVVANTFAKTQ